MVDTSRLKIPPVPGDLLSHGHTFSFGQLMRMARKHLGAAGSPDLPEIPWQERIRIRPALSLAFPAADVASVEAAGGIGENLLVTAAFLGLYGSSSPLPTHYTEDLLDDGSAESSSTRAFLDILHQRLYQLYFQCWSKYRLFYRVAEENDPQELERLFCLIGLGEVGLRKSMPDPASLLRYAGLLSQHPRSALGLQTMLRDALGTNRLEVEQCVLRQVPIPPDQQTCLGVGNAALGVNAFAGSQMVDRMGKFRIIIGPLAKAEYDNFLPGTTRHDRLGRLVELYLSDPLEYDLRLVLSAGEAQPLCLGDKGVRLGFNSWAYSGDFPGGLSVTLPATKPEGGVSEPAPAEPDASSRGGASTAIVEYFQLELARLRDLAAVYAKDHPEAGPLVSGHPADPSVERLFEGVAFLNACLQQKLDDDSPEIINEAIAATHPEYLRPTPASTIVTFTPKANYTGSQTIPAGTELQSVPVQGATCRFATRYPVEFHPLAVTAASFCQPPGKPAGIILNLKLTGVPLSSWKPTALRFFLAGEYADAANLYLLFQRYLKRVVVRPVQGGEVFYLDPSDVIAVGFERTQSLFPETGPGADGIRLLQEYFIQPDKFLFIDLLGWMKWTERGEGQELEIRFELESLPFPLHRISLDDFVLFATPAVNVFDHPAEPIVNPGVGRHYPVKPVGAEKVDLHVYSVREVTGWVDKRQRVSLPSAKQGVSRHSGTLPGYRIIWRKSGISHRLEAALCLEPPEKPGAKEMTQVLAALTCTNGALPGKLGVGDICRHTDSSPNFASFTNCKPVTPSRVAKQEKNAPWRWYSLANQGMSHLNLSSLQASLEQIADLYGNDHSSNRLNTTRIGGIVGLQLRSADRLVRGRMSRGWEIRVAVNPECYPSPGDLYLFGSLLDHYLNGLVTELCFTKTAIGNADGTLLYSWPARMGRRHVI